MNGILGNISCLYLDDKDAVGQGLRGNKIPQLERLHSYPRDGMDWDKYEFGNKVRYLFP